jgi:hypothetical protein
MCTAPSEGTDTAVGQGCFAYFRIYGLEGPVFDGASMPGDLDEVA